MDTQKMGDQLKRFFPNYLQLVFLDACAVIISLWAAWTIRAVTAKLEIAPLLWFSLLSVIIYCVCNSWLRLYQRIWEYATPAELVSIGLSTLGATFVMSVVDLLWPDYRPIPISVVVVAGLFSFIGFVAVRYRERMWTGLQWRFHSYRARRSLSRPRVLIVGAGIAGETLARRFLYTADSTRYQLVGFVDDNPATHRLRLHDLPIFGAVQLIPELVTQYHIDLVIIAIYNITDSNFQAILSICEKTPAAIKALPDLMDFLDTKGAVSSVRNISAKDLLGREPVKIDESACRGLLRGRRVLVTGAAGSIGSELCQQILRYEPKQLLMLDNNESGLYEMHNSLKRQQKEASTGQNTLVQMGDALVPIVSSVTNRSKMNRVFSKYKPEIVFHAAAYKHVPMMEDQPDEALWVNVYGTKNLVELSREYHTERFVLVSTDKAVQPVCIMGATKWLAELMIMNPGAWSRRERGADAVERRRKARNGNGHHNGDETAASKGTLFTAVR
ncbi:MAG TPA: polysaccharide biosynthesis protein, partial [Acidobacteriota bacterium]|nr:polysaccharide biosynthesis protein [Acidobacteriota bacterium]